LDAFERTFAPGATGSPSAAAAKVGHDSKPTSAISGPIADRCCARAIHESSIRHGKSKDELQAEEECKAQTVSRPGGFRNDPDDPTNPNEVRERYLRKLRELTYGRIDN
jgi:hypothetical protein